ncbi:MAG: sulfatase-like hydrolase/transferase [Geminicoccaceae bacterium]
MLRSALLIISVLVSESHAAFASPNLVVILADDLGYGEVGAQHVGDVATPNIDALARSGVTFTDGYVTAPSCVPSRAGLLTGRYQQELGIYGNPPMPRPANSGLPAGQITLADALRAQGYHTGMVGKWHLGEEPQDRPLQHGFDEFFGVLESDHPYFGEQESSPKPFHNPILRGTTPVPASGYLTDTLAAEAASFIERNASQPFFLYLPFTATHGPLQAKPDVLARVDGLASKRRLFAAVLASLDHAVGTVRRAIEDAGVADNTVVVFLGDNGCGLGRRTGCRNTPLSGWKYGYNEGGIRIPFVMSWPGRIPAGMRYGEPVISLDLFATLVRAAGGTPPGSVEGVDLLPYLRGADGTPHDYLFWGTRSTGAVRRGRWKLLDGALYDLSQDIAEQDDVAAGNPDVVADLLRAREAWVRTLAPALW